MSGTKHHADPSSVLAAFADNPNVQALSQQFDCSPTTIRRITREVNTSHPLSGIASPIYTQALQAEVRRYYNPARHTISGIAARFAISYTTAFNWTKDIRAARPDLKSGEAILAYVERGYTQREAAQHFGLHYNTICQRIKQARSRRDATSHTGDHQPTRDLSVLSEVS